MYNYLKDAKTIRNSTLCAYDSLDAYKTDFSVNGNVDGWDIYYNIYLYGCWNNVLFGTSYEHSCFIQRSNVFLSIEAEDYYVIELIMKITPDVDRPYMPTKGKIMWLRTDSVSWTEENSIIFDLDMEPNWQRYRINVGTSRWWQGYINNLRIYPFLDGHPKCQFAFKSIKILSINKFTCKQTSCDYYTKYVHPCPGAGKQGYCLSAEQKTQYTTISGISDTLLVNIDDYGDYKIELGTNIQVSSQTICDRLESTLSSLSVGGYAFVEVEVTEDDHILIKSGTFGKESAVRIKGGSAAYELCFYNEAGLPIYSYDHGRPTASYYKSASPAKLSYKDIKRLLDNSDKIVYNHKPDEYDVEIGNKDFYYSITSNSTDKFSSFYFIKNISNSGSTIVDVSHPASAAGLITDIYVNGGRVRKGAKIYLLRPRIDGSYKKIASLEVPLPSPNLLYTIRQTTQHIECNLLVAKGDVFAIYNLDVAVSVSQFRKTEDATFFKYLGDLPDIFTPKIPKATGVIGFHIFGRGNVLRDTILLDIDFGSRINLDRFSVKGQEYVDEFEYNLAICEDLDWKIDCRGETHVHHLSYCIAGGITVTHENIPYGIDCLSDGIVTLDGGQQGDSFSSGSDGIITSGKHSYCYVNGDGEWAFGKINDPNVPIYEFYLPPFCQHSLTDYVYDPIHYILSFPHGLSVEIYKSRIFFKEGKNFRHFSLQYYVSDEIAQYSGKKVGYHYVPKYNSIVLDSVKYDESSFEGGELSLHIKDYLFVNPTAWPEPIYSGETCLNWDIVQTSRDLSWNVMEHNFDRVDCAGFRLITAFHVSTKLIEFEIYSSFPVKPALVDNVLITLSTDGIYWKEASFAYTDDPLVIEATSNIAPRYMRVALYSEDIFSLYGLNAQVTQSVETEHCLDEIVLDFEQDNILSAIQEVVFTNTYNSLAHFTVKLPKTLEMSNYLVIDVDLLEQVDTDCVVVYKNPDWSIQLANKNIANNCSAFGLVNLVDGNKAYTLSNVANVWEYFGVLQHGSSLDLTYSSKGTLNYVVFAESHYRYLILCSSNGSFYIDNLLFFSQGVLVEPKYVYYGGRIKDTSLGIFLDIAGIEVTTLNVQGDYKDFLFFASNFQDFFDYNIWTVNSTPNVFGNSFDMYPITKFIPGRKGYSLYPKILLQDTFISGTINYEKISSFHFKTEVLFNCSNVHPLSLVYNFKLDEVVIFKCVFMRDISGHYKLYLYDSDDNTLATSTIATSETTTTFVELLRENDSLQFKVYSSEGAQYLNITISNFTTEYINILECSFISYLETFVITDFINVAILNIELYALHYVSKKDTFIIDFGKNIVLDRFSILTLDNISDLFLVASYNLDTKCDKKEILYVEQTSFEYSLSIDLGQPHLLDIVRNYGVMPNKLNISLSSKYVQYSYTDTNKVQEVDWGSNYDVCWLNFNEETGSANFIDNLKSSRHIVSYGALSSTLKKVTGSTSCYLDGKAYIKAQNSLGDFSFKDEDFGVLFFFYMGTNVYEDIFLIGNWGSTGTDKSFVIGINSQRKVFFKYTVDGIELKTIISNTKVSIGQWVCVEISRKYWYLYLFINGNLENIFSIERDYLQEGVSDLYIGQMKDINYNGFYGYVDNIYIRKGAYLHTSNYNVDVFLKSQLRMSYAEHRWVRINIPTSHTYTIDKLGIYPDIQRAITYFGNNNCIWQALGPTLTEYINVPYNIAPVYYKIYASSTVYDSDVVKAVNGLTKVYDFKDCWGFSVEDVEPTVTLIFDNYYKIDTINLFHGAEEQYNYQNNDYIIYGYPTASGTENIELVNVVNNISRDTSHVFTPVVLQKIKLVIKKYTSANVEIPSKDILGNSTTVTLDGGFLREIEILTSAKKHGVSSEDYPVLCFNLNDQFNISAIQYLGTYLLEPGIWLNFVDNKESYSFYSDNLYNDPQKISFIQSAERSIYFEFEDQVLSSLVLQGYYILGSDIFLEEAVYLVDCSFFDNTGDKSAHLEIAGPGGIIRIYPEKEGPNIWLEQLLKFTVVKTGFYEISFVLDTTANFVHDKGVSNVFIYRVLNLVKWFATKNDTATDYTFDGIAAHKGPHSLNQINIFGGDEYSIIEYPYWWLSRLSKLSYNSVTVLEGRRSLQIDYPTSSGIDYFTYREADSFISDPVWLEKDFLSFNWYIDNINNLDLTYGGIGFGNPNGIASTENLHTQTAGKYSYGWELSTLNLVSGWNKVNLKFSEAAYVLPENTNTTNTNLFNPTANIRDNIMIGFIVYYRGNAKGPLRMCIDGLKIKRNIYEEKVFDKHALCLSFNEFAELNLSNLTIDKGTVSLTMKMYNDTRGLTKFNELTSRTIFSMISNNNDIIILGIKQGSWFEFGVGDAWKKYVVFSLTDEEISPDSTYIDYDEPFHICVMWDNMGGMSNGDSFRLYLNGDLIWYSKETWIIDSFNVNKLILGGGAPVTSFSNLAEGAAIYSNVKVYNYCLEGSDYKKDVLNNKLIPSDYVYISIDDQNYYGKDYAGMPLTISGVQPGEQVIVYIKALKTATFKYLKNKSANLLVDWIVTV